MKYYMGNTSVKIHNIHFDVLTTILDAILHIEIILLLTKTCLINVCLSQNASILSVHISCKQVKLCVFLLRFIMVAIFNAILQFLKATSVVKTFL